MAVVLVCEAICVADGGKAAGIAAVFFIFMFEGCFTWGWMATSWVYPAEILPLKLRAKGSALAAAADFLGNFVVSLNPLVGTVIHSDCLSGRRNHSPSSAKHRIQDVHYLCRLEHHHRHRLLHLLS
jgi:hypothetical protein